MQLGDDSLDHVGFVVVGLLVEGDRAHRSVLELNFERLVADLHRLVFELFGLDVSFPSLIQLLVDAHVLGVVQSHLESIAVTWTNGELGLHQHASPLILQVGKSGESAGVNVVTIFLVLIPCTVPSSVRWVLLLVLVVDVLTSKC